MAREYTFHVTNQEVIDSFQKRYGTITYTRSGPEEILVTGWQPGIKPEFFDIIFTHYIEGWHDAIKS